MRSDGLARLHEGVPRHERTVFAPKRTRYCVAVFALNEGERLLAQLERMAPHATHADILLADGGSTDGSTNEARLGRLGVRTLLVKTEEGGLSTQMRMAFHYALTEGYEGVVTVDGNGKDGVNAIPAFVACLAEGWDHVQGSRYVPGGEAVCTPFLRHWGVKLIHAPLISLAAHHRYTDTTNGFRAYSRAFLLDPRVAPLRPVFRHYELHYYLAIRAARLGYRVTEIPVRRAYPDQGPTPTKIRGVRGALRILCTLGRACLGRYTPRQESTRG